MKDFFYRNTNRLLVAMFGCLATALLIGNVFGCIWAGGEGCTGEDSASSKIVQLEGSATIARGESVRPASEGEHLRRGEIIRTDSGSRAKIQIDVANELFLDERTDIRLDDLRLTTLAVTVMQGRVFYHSHLDASQAIPTGAMRLSSQRTDVSIPYGSLSVVNYAFKDVFAVFPVGTFAAVVTSDDNGLITKTGIEIHEREPITVTDVTFDPQNSAAAEFYRWVGLIQ